MRVLPAACIVALLTGGATLAVAQEQNALGLSAIYSANIFQHDVIAMGKPAPDSEQSGADAQDPAVRQALSYKPSPDVERRIRKKLVDSLLESTSDPATQTQIKKTVASDEVWLQFHQVLSEVGYSTTNLADVTTAYYVIAWEVVSDDNASVPAAAVRAVREDVVSALAADPRLKDLSDADKQEAASIMAYMATIAAASANQLRSSGNQAGLRQLRDEVHKAVLDQGLDLAQLRLTEQGFTPR